MKSFNQFSKFRSFLFIPVFFLTYSLPAQTGQQENSVVLSSDDQTLQWSPCPDFMPQGCTLTILNGDPAQKNADVLLKIPANAEIANHTHTSAERMVLIDGELEVQYEGEQPQVIEKGFYAYGPAGKPHSAKCGDTPCVLFIAFEEPVDAMPVEPGKKK